MAEEKTTKTTTKKKDSSKEVKVEKRFCTNCGKELCEKEVCNCVSENKAVNVNSDALISEAKNYLNTIINMFKKPGQTIKEEVANNNIKKTFIMLAIIAITYGLYIMGGFTSIISLINGFASTDINNYIEIPYFKIFIYMTLIYFVLAFIPALIAFAVARITGNKDFDFKKSMTLYVTSMAPMVFTNLLMAILYGLNILTWIGAIISCVISIACFFHYIIGFLDVTNINENKKSYALTSLIISWVIVAVIAVVVLAGSLFSDLSRDFGINDDYDYGYNDSFNW